MVWEYLSLHIAWSMPEYGPSDRQDLSITVNGMKLGFLSNKVVKPTGKKNPTNNTTWTKWELQVPFHPDLPGYKHLTKQFMSKLAIDYQIVQDLVELLQSEKLILNAERPGANLDPAVIANFFAKDGWKLCKVRDRKEYLMFEREI